MYIFFFQAEDGIRDLVRSRGLGDVYKRQGHRDSKINNAEGQKQETIKYSEADRERQVNQAKGQAEAILSVAKASADGIKMVCLLYTSPSPRDRTRYRMPSSA